MWEIASYYTLSYLLSSLFMSFWVFHCSPINPCCKFPLVRCYAPLYVTCFRDMTLFCILFFRRAAERCSGTCYLIRQGRFIATRPNKTGIRHKRVAVKLCTMRPNGIEVAGSVGSGSIAYYRHKIAGDSWESTADSWSTGFWLAESSLNSVIAADCS